MAHGFEEVVVFFIAHRKDLEDLLLSYGGVVMRMLIDFEKWTVKALVAYTGAAVVLVQIASAYLSRYGINPEIGSFVMLTVGFCGHTVLRYFLEDFILDVMKEAKKSVLEVMGAMRNRLLAKLGGQVITQNTNEQRELD